MDIIVRIDGVPLDGISKDSVKLNVNNPNPFTLSEPTVTYTASIEVPRSENNDRIFRADRYPWLYARTAPYSADLIFDGLAAPRGLNVYRARVAVNENSYSVTLVESFTKLSDILAPVVAKPYNESAPVYWNNNYDNALSFAYNGNLERPSLISGDEFAYPVYIAEKRDTLASDIINKASQLAYRTGHNYLLGARYPSSDMLILDNTTACALDRMTGSTFTLSFTEDCFVWLPAENAPATIYLGCNNSTGSIAMNRSFSPVNGNYRYRIQFVSNLTVRPSTANPTMFHIRTAAATTSTKLTPTTNMPTDEGYFFSFNVISAGTGSYSKQLAPETGFSSAYDLVQAYCKAFFWVYEFTPSPFKIKLRPLINTSDIAIYRQDWTGKIDMPTVKLSEPEGAARTYKCVTGDAFCTVGGSARAMETTSQGVESSLPISFGQPPLANMVHLTDGNPEIDLFFLNNQGYRAMAEAHYKWFTPGWQLSAKMRLSYFDIKSMTSDGLYYIGELHSWFYLRSIQNWNAGDSTATVTLIAVNK